MKIIGIILIVAGLALTLFTSVSFFTKEKVADIGSLEITKNKVHNFNWPPLVGVAVMLGGVSCLILANKKSS